MIDIRSFQFIAILVAFIILTILVHFHFVSSVDAFIFNASSSFSTDQYFLYTFVIISSFGEVVNLIIVAIIFTIIRRTRKMGMILMITIMILAILVSYVKPLVGQPKPPESKIPDLPEGFELESDSLLVDARAFSYPSNHTATITSFAYIVGTIVKLKSKKHAKILWILPPMLMISNVLLGLNYLSDLLGGLLLGLVISITISNVLKLEVPFTLNKFKNPRQ